MARSFHQIFNHFVWATKNREPYLTDEVRDRVHAEIRRKCESMGCLAIAIGSIEDQVHLLVEMIPRVSPSALIQGVKGSSSHLISHELMPDCPFRWQEAYGVFSISKRIVPKTQAYVLNQRTHHTIGPLFAALERSE